MLIAGTCGVVLQCVPARLSVPVVPFLIRTMRAMKERAQYVLPWACIVTRINASGTEIGREDIDERVFGTSFYETRTFLWEVFNSRTRSSYTHIRTHTAADRLDLQPEIDLPVAADLGDIQLENEADGEQAGENENENEWACVACTYINPSLFLACEICATVRPAKKSKDKEKEREQRRQPLPPRARESRAVRFARALREQEKEKEREKERINDVDVDQKIDGARANVAAA